MTDLVFKNARIVLEHEAIQGSLHVKDGRIAAIAEGPCSLPGAIDLEDDWLIPGLVELHTDNLERCFEPRPKVRWPAEAAILAHDAQMALSGVTTVCDAVCVGFYDDKQARLALLSQSLRAIEQARAKDALACDHYLHLRLEITDPNVVALTEPLVDEPSLVVVSFMDHTPGQRQWQDLAKYRQFQMGRNGKTSDEFETMLAQRVEEQVLYAERHKRELLALFAGRSLVMASHDDTTVEHVDEAVRDGITISEFPTTMAAARAARDKGLVTVMGGPNLVLGGSHSGNVSAGELVDEGLLDCFSSDYVPTSLLNAAFIMHRRHERPVPEAVATVTSTPARVLGLSDRGRIAVGLRADLVRVREVGQAVRGMGVWKMGRRIA
ncbi:alpha-D-ribose 1-methylphosphonate 5-triphosphate diphosphatase [Geminicoccus roseus]|uniref:alpha-D-ribose 1-methylphosphonate 5-triphosphate diphosphatase n=1 Tax=Geminicoccus roseus TaxID=404900 RepID=UPI0003F744FB|nr:alpha-D-ribose 1-methylphosphonate 5-triphosphate diphosphatase [Geminicoccus roseus]